MKLQRIFAMAAAAMLVLAFPSSAALFNHSTLDGILRHYVDQDGYVDYDAVRLNSMTALESYFGTLANADLAGWPQPERTAFWINAYNAQVLYRVAQKPRLKKMSEAWGLLELPFKVAGQTLSPVDIKHLLRKDGDPRLLFSLSDGTIGGPKLRNTAYTAENLDGMLQANASSFVNSAQYVKEARGHLQLSNLFKWYAKDFEKAGGAPAYISGLLVQDQHSDFEAIQHLLTTAYKKSSFHYDWTFNDRKNKPLSLQTQKLTPHVIPPDALSTSNPDLSDESH